MSPRGRASKSPPPTAIDLFCGGGGLSLGFCQGGFEVVAAVDSDPTAISAHHLNFPNAVSLRSDIQKVCGTSLLQLAKMANRQLDVLIGGPPCQGFSVGGFMDPGDERNSLIQQFARLVREIRPRYFVMENVQGILQPRFADHLGRFRRVIARAGYRIALPLKVLDAQDYGVPQRRKRVFLLGHQIGLQPPVYPEPNLGPTPTVWDAIGDLAAASADPHCLAAGLYSGVLGRPSIYSARLRSDLGPLTGFQSTVHSASTLRRFAELKPGHRDPVSRFHRLKKDGVACTLRAGTGQDRGRFMAPRPVHPVFDRCINVREAARLHSFPDSFVFHDTKWHALRHIGNSVPPLLAEAIARSIRVALVSVR